MQPEDRLAEAEKQIELAQSDDPVGSPSRYGTVLELVGRQRELIETYRRGFEEGIIDD